jgi:hypothetical protein
VDTDEPAALRHTLGPGDAQDSSGPDRDIVDTLAYPISPDYVKSWVAVRGLCELIANALDEGPQARVGWADGVLTIADDGPSIPEEGLILGCSSKTTQQIGQFGEGKKLAMLILARSPQIGAVRCDTVGYGFTPSVEARRLLGGLIPSRSAQGTEVLVYRLFRTDRTRGTTITVACPQQLAEEAIGRFRALTECCPALKMPTSQSLKMPTRVPTNRTFALRLVGEVSPVVGRVPPFVTRLRSVKGSVRPTTHGWANLGSVEPETGPIAQGDSVGASSRPPVSTAITGHRSRSSPPKRRTRARAAAASAASASANRVGPTLVGSSSGSRATTVCTPSRRSASLLVRARRSQERTVAAGTVSRVANTRCPCPRAAPSSAAPITSRP